MSDKINEIEQLKNSLKIKPKKISCMISIICPLCFKNYDGTSITIFSYESTIRKNYGILYCDKNEKCRDKVKEFENDMEKILNMIIQNVLNVNESNFTFTSVKNILMKNNLSVKRSSGTIENDWKFSDLIITDEIKIIIGINNDEYEKYVPVEELIELNRDLFIKSE